MTRNVYCCNTYYHLLIAIIKAQKTVDCESSLIIFSDKVKSSILRDQKIVDRIRRTGIFKDVMIFDHSQEEQAQDSKKMAALYRFFYVKKLLRSEVIDFRQYDNVYQFIDHTLLGKIIQGQKVKYVLLEDGMDTFKINYARMKPKKDIKHFIKKVFHIPEYAQSKYIKEIEVNSAEGLLIHGKTIKECKKTELFSSLTSEEKKNILRIFPIHLDLSDLQDAVLCITQPLSEDGIVSSEQYKIELYAKLLNKYCKNQKALIKPHPREMTDYRKYFKNYKIIEDVFPIEILNFIPVKLDKVITIASTSANSIVNCRKKIILGWEWINKHYNK